jgi:hypothetical protein
MVLALYPLAWRRRYGAEMEALVEDSGASPRAVADLARGAVRAHLRPGSATVGTVDRGDRVRLGVSAVLLCWVLFAAAILAFAKTTEDPAFRAAAAAHPVLGGAHLALQVLAVLAASAFLLGAGPLVAVALVQVRRRPGVRRAVLLASGCIGVSVAATAAFVLVARHEPAPSDPRRAVLFTAWVCIGMACAIGCALAARRGLFAAAVPVVVLRFAAACAVALVVAMVGIAVATLLYLVALIAVAADLGSIPNGPFGNPDTRLSLLIQLLLMVAVATPATLAASRAWRAGLGRR